MIQFITICLELAVFLAMYLATEINMSQSTYGVRRRITQTEYENNMYYKWYTRKEKELEILYKQEYCEAMTLSFDDFCQAVYNELKIIYA